MWKRWVVARGVFAGACFVSMVAVACGPDAQPSSAPHRSTATLVLPNVLHPERSNGRGGPGTRPFTDPGEDTPEMLLEAVAQANMMAATSVCLLCWLVLATACGASSGSEGPPDATAGHDEGSSLESSIEGSDSNSGDASQSGDVRADSGDRDGGPLPDALADGDAPECPPDDPTPPVITSTSTIAFVLTNMSPSDRWLLTQSTDCETFSMQGVVTELPPNTCGGGMYPPERLYFQKLATGQSATLTWDARGLALYTTYERCSPNSPGCSSVSNGSPQPVNPGQWVAQFAVGSMAPTGSGTQCGGTVSGDVICTVTVQNGMPQRGGQCTWSNVSLIQATFTVPSSGNVTVNVAIP
jgi:hypothetical protein